MDPKPFDPAQRRRGRWMLVGLFALFFGTVFGAGILRFSGWQPAGHKNHGQLLQPLRCTPVSLVCRHCLQDMKRHFVDLALTRISGQAVSSFTPGTTLPTEPQCIESFLTVPALTCCTRGDLLIFTQNPLLDKTTTLFALPELFL